MITSIVGRLEGTGPGWVEIAVGGVSLRVHVPTPVVEGLGRKGDQVRLFTHLQVREDGLSLFGFESADTRAAFEALIGVNGIGPRLALSVLSRLTPGSLALAVASGDIEAFAGVPGVGKKTASRIILELSGKLDGLFAAVPTLHHDAEVVEALTALGYTAQEAREAALAVPHSESTSLADRVRVALQRMAGP